MCIRMEIIEYIKYLLYRDFYTIIAGERVDRANSVVYFNSKSSLATTKTSQLRTVETPNYFAWCTLFSRLHLPNVSPRDATKYPAENFVSKYSNARSSWLAGVALSDRITSARCLKCDLVQWISRCRADIRVFMRGMDCGK